MDHVTAAEFWSVTSKCQAWINPCLLGMCIHVHTCMYISIYIYLSIYIYIYIYIYIGIHVYIWYRPATPPPRHGHGSPSLWECVGVSPCTGPQTGTIFTHTYIYTHIYIYIYIGIIYMKRFRQLCCINVAADAVRAHSFVLLANSLRLKAC